MFVRTDGGLRVCVCFQAHKRTSMKRCVPNILSSLSRPGWYLDCDRITHQHLQEDPPHAHCRNTTGKVSSPTSVVRSFAAPYAKLNDYFLLLRTNKTFLFLPVTFRLQASNIPNPGL